MAFRVAVLNCGEAVPWIPLVAALREGFAELGADVRMIRVSEMPDLFLGELRQLKPDLALLPFCKWEWKRRGHYMRELEALGAVKAAVLWDDPYDMETGLALAEEVDAVFTPEELALEFYERKRPAFHQLPFVSGDLHYLPSFERPMPKRTVDVAMVGGVFWRPRSQILPVIRNLCQAGGLNYTEVAGVSRWLAGRGLTNFLHRTRVLLEIPRHDLPTRSNPHQVPCTYTGPRVYIAERCGTEVLTIGPRADFGERFPMYRSVPGIEEAVPALAELLEGPCNSACGRHLPEDRHPVTNAAAMLTRLVGADLFDGAALESATALLSRGGQPGSSDSRSRDTEASAAAPGSPR